jgi:hypothetical protein
MAFKKKAAVKVGTKDWEVIVPRPPNHATHARMRLRDEFREDGTPKEATLPIQDFGCFKGVAGDFSYLRMDKKGKIHEEYDATFFWNGYQVSGIDELLNQ